MQVKIECAEPYLSPDGFYYKIWSKLKEKLDYEFKEETISDISESKDADVLISISKLEQTDEWLYTLPIFTRTFVLIYESKRMTVWELFYKLFLKRFIPIVTVFIVVSIVLGELLYRFSPRKSRKNAFWQSFSGVLGAYGYVAEKLSDHPNKVQLSSYIITAFVLICILYMFLYLQATINTTMLFSRDQMVKGTSSLDATSYVLVDAPNTVISQKEAPFELVFEDTNNGCSLTDSLVAKLGRLKEYNALLTDIVAANHVLLQPEYGKRLNAEQTTLGSYGVSIAVSKKHPNLFIEMNNALAQMRNEITDVCTKEIHTAPGITLLKGTNSIANMC